MNPRDAQYILNKKFVYAPDGWLDKWTILDTSKDVVYGDCEDYSLTLAWLIADESMIKFLWGVLSFRFIFWHVKSPRGEGHAIMWVRDTGKYTDNIQRMFKTKKELKELGYKFVFPQIIPTLFFKMLYRYTLGFFSKGTKE